MVIYNVVAGIEVDGSPITNYISLHISQRFNEHHEFHIRLPYSMLESDSFSLNTIKNFIGKVAIIRLHREIEFVTLNEFKGIVADVMIEQVDSNHTEVVLRGYSPTILMEKGPHTTCFIQKNLQKIVAETTQDLAGECTINNKPFNESSQKNNNYFTQYQESNFEFLNRLSAEFGEWFFFDGKNLNFGKPAAGDPIDLVMGEDVTALQLKLQMAPASFNTYSYNSKDDTTHTSASPKSVSGVGQYGKTALEESNKLFTPTNNVFVRPRVENKSELDKVLKLQTQAKASSMCRILRSWTWWVRPRCRNA